jgi:hypothetical protein
MSRRVQGVLKTCDQKTESEVTGNKVEGNRTGHGHKKEGICRRQRSSQSTQHFNSSLKKQSKYRLF